MRRDHTPRVSRVSVTIGHYVSGWGFYAWTNPVGEATVVAHVRAVDLARRFSTPREAVTHCRVLYKRSTFRLVPAADAPEVQRIGRRLNYRISLIARVIEATRDFLRRSREARQKRLKF